MLKRRLPVLAVVLGVFAWALAIVPGHRLSAFDSSEVMRVLPPVGLATDNQESSRFETRFISDTVGLHSHSSSVAELGNGNLLAVWYAGSREGAVDVEILSSVFDQATRIWKPNRSLTNRASTAAGVRRYIRKLGNPALGVAPDGRVWLFFVSVSVGGWACSQVNVMYSDDQAQSWSAPRRLITSPSFNMSTLVRGGPVFHADGSVGIPVYHESLGKFSEYLRIDRNMAVLDKSRMTRGKHSLQPTVAVLDGENAWALIRYAGEPPMRLMASRTRNAGSDWATPITVDVPNPNSSVSALGDADGVLVVLNDVDDGRHRLSLFRADGNLENWQRLKVLEASSDPEGGLIPPELFVTMAAKKFQSSADDARQGLLNQYVDGLGGRSCNADGCKFEYEYPSLIRTRAGDYHLTYSWNKSLIKHAAFNQAWLEQL